MLHLKNLDSTSAGEQKKIADSPSSHFMDTEVHIHCFAHFRFYPTHTHTHIVCLLIMCFDGRIASKKRKTETNKQKCPHTGRQICDGNFFNSNSQNSLQCSKVKQDVRMLRATASSFLDGGCCC